ncbi:MAG: hypothetical protein H6621_10940 [Halobacteriovoraceae bacterium]|nr:hypothetical protein [Halobacteriovoraceae bacterium]MCB9095573.1 hypothetical protein [Halobacteriovoraceae bacterium]
MIENSLYQILVRVPKNKSSFLYFTLESHENLCFYSTKENSLKMPYRDVEINATFDFRPQLEHIIDRLGHKFPVEILESTTYSLKD